MKKFILRGTIFLTLTFIICGCKKQIPEIETNTKITSPILIKNSAAPNGVLHFANKESLNEVIRIIKNGKNNSLIPSNFKSLNKLFENNLMKATTVDPNVYNDYLYNQYQNLLPDAALPDVLNSNLQIMVGTNLYQVTRIGTFIVDQLSIDNFTNWYNNNQNGIWYDPQIVSIPGEVYLGDNLYQIEPGIIRAEINVEDITDISTTQSGPAILIPDSEVPQSYGPNIPMETYTVGNEFRQDNGKIYFDDRRFVFKAYNINYVFFRSIGIQAKLQRKKRVLFISYWGESFADELIVGGENMDLKTGYIAPTPEIMAHNLMNQPTFNGLIDFKLGNFVTTVFHWNVNSYVLGRTINSNDLSRWANGGINSFANNTFNTAMQSITNGLANYLDPSYKSRLNDNGMVLKSYQDDSRLRFTLSNVGKYQGYSHKNDWNFDWNFMIGTSGQTAYDYEMIGGSFYAKA
ncbi:MAG: hypothetical protein Q8K64_14295 [Sediminibacterium sp.]|nr:hypothetical protein [Sediminibacterium sp.]